jgi:hypothetical protein
MLPYLMPVSFALLALAIRMENVVLITGFDDGLNVGFHLRRGRSWGRACIRSRRLVQAGGPFAST